MNSDGAQVALIRRFDRENGARILYASAATMMGVERRDGQDHAYTEIVDAIRVHAELDQFADAFEHAERAAARRAIQ